MLPGLRHMGDAGNCLVFLWGEGPKTHGREKCQRAKHRVECSPARQLPALPAVFGGRGSPQITGGICWLPFCLAQATARSWEGGRGCACVARLHSGLEMLSASPLELPGSALLAWRDSCCCIPRQCPGAGELGQGDVGKGWQSRGMRVPMAWACSERGVGNDCERGGKDTRTPGVRSSLGYLLS